MKRKLIVFAAALFAILLCLSFYSVSAAVVDSGTCGDNVTWTLDDAGTLTISGTGDMYDYAKSSGYSNRSINKIIISDGVTSIGDDAFYGCENLANITIPDSVTSIGDDAFSNCKSLTSITIPNGVTYIGDGTFDFCTNLTSITIPNSVTSIGDCAFSICASLSSITIPNSVTNIGSQAFMCCESLTSITIPGSVTSIGEWAFSYCNNLTRITVESSNPNYVSDENGCLFNKDKTTLICYPAAKKEHKYIVPSSVTSIGDYAFHVCESLTSITIPDSVTSIGDYAFSGCDSLTGITIPDSVTSIGFGAFEWCKSLTSATIRDGVTTIPYCAFCACDSLTSITIPSSVTSIEANAFECENLTTVYYEGAQEQWDAIDIGYDNNAPLFNANIIYNAKNLNNSVNVSIPTFNVSLSGKVIDNTYRQYPLIIYNDITYFPMTYFDSRLMGLETRYSLEKGLSIWQTAGEFGYQETNAQTPNYDEYTATVATGSISVNGKAIDNSTEKYPLLLFRDVTYFPLTWRFAVGEFGWSYHFDTEQGLVISK